MKTKAALTLVIISRLIMAFGSKMSYAQSNPLFVQLSGATMAVTNAPGLLVA